MKISEYFKYWKKEIEILEREIAEIGDNVYAISQIKEKKIIQKILLDLPEFLEFIRDNKGLSIAEHESEGFERMISFMTLN